MAITTKWYGLGVKDQFDGTAADRVDWVNDTIKVALTTSSYVPNQDTDEFFSAVTNELPTAGGYTAGGATLASKSLTYDATTNESRLIAGNTSWTTATFTARIAVIYKSTGVAGTSKLLGYVDFGADQTVTAGTFQLTWDSTGVLKITAS